MHWDMDAVLSALLMSKEYLTASSRRQLRTLVVPVQMTDFNRRVSSSLLGWLSQGGHKVRSISQNFQAHPIFTILFHRPLPAGILSPNIEGISRSTRLTGSQSSLEDVNGVGSDMMARK